MSEQQMAHYTLTVVADSGYESTTEGRCTSEQYGQAMAALHGTARKPLTDEELDRVVLDEMNLDRGTYAYLMAFKVARAIEAAHGIKGDA